MVNVGCKLPNGFWMELITPGEKFVPKPVGERVLIKGSNSMIPGVIVGRMHQDPPKARAVDAVAFTPVAKDFWDKWLSANKDTQLVKGGFVFAEAKQSNAEAMGREVEKEKTGLEALPIGSNDEMRARLRNQEFSLEPATVAKIQRQ